MRLHDKTFEKTIAHERIVEAIEALATRLNSDYADKTPILVGVLNGSFMFMAELAKHLEFTCEVSFVKISSYSGTQSTGSVEELIGLGCDVSGRHIIIVEDIVETGRSIGHIMHALEGMHPASVEVASLFFKPDVYSATKEVKYHALPIPNDFIVGFGLDYNGLGRNLRDIYKVKE